MDEGTAGVGWSALTPLLVGVLSAGALSLGGRTYAPRNALLRIHAARGWLRLTLPVLVQPAPVLCELLSLAGAVSVTLGSKPNENQQ